MLAAGWIGWKSGGSWLEVGCQNPPGSGLSAGDLPEIGNCPAHTLLRLFFFIAPFGACRIKAGRGATEWRI